MLISKHLRFTNMAVLFTGTVSLVLANTDNKSPITGVDIVTGWGGNGSTIADVSSKWLLRSNICVSTLTVSTCTCKPNVPQLIGGEDGETSPDRDEPWSDVEYPQMTSVPHQEYTTGNNSSILISYTRPWFRYGNISSDGDLPSTTSVDTLYIPGNNSQSEYLTITPSMTSISVSPTYGWHHVRYFNTTTNSFKTNDNSSLAVQPDASSGIEGAETEPFCDGTSSEPCDDSSSIHPTYDSLTTESTLPEKTFIDEFRSESSTAEPFDETTYSDIFPGNLSTESSTAGSTIGSTTIDDVHASLTTNHDDTTTTLDLGHNSLSTSLKSSFTSVSTDWVESSAEIIDSSSSSPSIQTYIPSSTFEDCDESSISEVNKSIRSGYSNNKGTPRTKPSTLINLTSLTYDSNYSDSPATKLMTTEHPALHHDNPVTSERNIILTSYATPTTNTIQTQYDDWSNYWDEEEWSKDLPGDLWRDFYEDIEKTDDHIDSSTYHTRKTTFIDRWMYTYTGSKKYFPTQTSSPLPHLKSSDITSVSGFASSSDRQRKIMPTTERTELEHHTQQLSSSSVSRSLSLKNIAHTTSSYNTRSYPSSEETVDVSSNFEEEPISTSLIESSETRVSTYKSLETETLHATPSRIRSKTFTRSSSKHSRASRTNWKSIASEKYSSAAWDPQIEYSELTTSSIASLSYKHTSRVQTSSKLAAMKHTPNAAKPTRIYSYRYLPKKSTDFISIDPSSTNTNTITHIKVEQTLSASTSDSTQEISTSTLARPWYKSKPKNETVQHLSNASNTSVFYLLIIPCLSLFVIL